MHVFAIHDSPIYYEVSEDDHPRTVTHARDHWWTLDFANAFLSPGVNSRAELVPSPRAYVRNSAPRRWLGDKLYTANCIKVVLRQSWKVKAKREKYDGCYELNIHLAYIRHTEKNVTRKQMINVICRNTIKLFSAIPLLTRKLLLWNSFTTIRSA
jgi:hypothetical protein